jgi:flagella basal body P-ring formation protein FlgA
MHASAIRSLFLSGLVPGVLLTLAPAALADAAWQRHESIRQAAEAAARVALAGPAEVTADSPDPRLKLVLCDQPLTATVPANGARAPRLTAEVRCAGSQPWRLYVPVRVTATRQVVVATRALPRDTVLAPGDVRLANAAAGTPPAGVLHDPGLAVGRRLRRATDEGQPVTVGVLAAATLVRRGQQVLVEAGAGDLKVRMAGVARSDGALGDLIEVENGSSGRVVQAIVRSEKSVEVLLR